MIQPEPSQNDRAGPNTRLYLGVALVLLLTHGVLAWMVRTPAITTGNDDALYLLLARSLRSFHYLDSHIVGSPMHAQYPPGFPAFLAFFGGSFNAATLGSIVVSVVGLALTYDLARRAIGPVPGLLVLAALVLNPALIEWGGSVRSEAVFMTAGVGAIWWASRARVTTGALVAAGALGIYAAMVRSVGVALVCALLILWLIQGRYRAALIFSGAAALIVGGWLVLTALAPGKFYGRSYTAALNRAESAPTAIGVLVNRVEASVAYLYRNIPSAFSVPTLEGTIADNVLWAVFLTAALLVGLYALWRKFPVVTLYLLGTAAVLTLYPFKMTRFIVPVVPLLLLAMAAGLVMLARRVSGRGSLLATSLLCLPLIVGGVNVDLRMINQSRQCETSDPWGPTLCSTPAQRGFFAAAAFARSSLPRDAVVVTVKEATFALLTDLRVQHPERVIRQDSINLIETMQANGVGYILVTPIHHSRLSRLLLAECAQLEVVESFTDDTHILKIAAEQEHDSREACEVLRRVARDSRFTPADQLAPE